MNQFSCILASFSTDTIFYSTCSNDYKMISHGSFICISLMVNDVKHLFMCLLSTLRKDTCILPIFKWDICLFTVKL